MKSMGHYIEKLWTDQISVGPTPGQIPSKYPLFYRFGPHKVPGQDFLLMKSMGHYIEKLWTDQISVGPTPGQIPSKYPLFYRFGPHKVPAWNWFWRTLIYHIWWKWATDHEIRGKRLSQTQLCLGIVERGSSILIRYQAGTYRIVRLFYMLK